MKMSLLRRLPWVLAPLTAVLAVTPLLLANQLLPELRLQHGELALGALGVVAGWNLLSFLLYVSPLAAGRWRLLVAIPGLGGLLAGLLLLGIGGWPGIALGMAGMVVFVGSVLYGVAYRKVSLEDRAQLPRSQGTGHAGLIAPVGLLSISTACAVLALLSTSTAFLADPYPDELTRPVQVRDGAKALELTVPALSVGYATLLGEPGVDLFEQAGVGVSVDVRKQESGTDGLPVMMGAACAYEAGGVDAWLQFHQTTANRLAELAFMEVPTSAELVEWSGNDDREFIECVKSERLLPAVREHLNSTEPLGAGGAIKLDGELVAPSSVEELLKLLKK